MVRIVTYKGRLGIVLRGKKHLVVEWFAGGRATIKASKVTFIEPDDIAGFDHSVRCLD